MMRVSIPKKLRFDVFKRDGFVCQYCGAHPSETVLLEVDHINPVAEGGGNDMDNLVTACFDCNRGKGAALLSNIPKSLGDKAVEAQERERQILGYYEILEAIKARKEEELWYIAEMYMDRYGDDSILRSRLASIRTFLQKLNFYEVQEAMQIALDKCRGRGQSFSYFCGICWRKIKRNAE